MRRDENRQKEEGKGKGLAGGLSPKELGVVVNHDGSVESVMPLAGGKTEWWMAGLDLACLGVLD